MATMTDGRATAVPPRIARPVDASELVHDIHPRATKKQCFFLEGVLAFLQRSCLADQSAPAPTDRILLSTIRDRMSSKQGALGLGWRARQCARVSTGVEPEFRR